MKNLFKQDKLDHFILSAILSGLLMLIAIQLIGFVAGIIVGSIITLLIGIAWEVKSLISGKGACEWGDIVADAAGIIFMIFVILIFWQPV